MSGYIKYFENGGKSIPFVVKDDDVLDTYHEIWNKIKETLNIKFHTMPVYDEKYIKAQVRDFNRVIKANFLGDEVPKENVHYTCVACITIDFVVKMEEKNHPQVIINTNLESESESESELKSDTELESKSKLKSDSE